MILIFDLDGTILDTFDLIRGTFIEVFKRFLPTYKYTEEDLRSFFGPSLYDTFRKIGCDEEKCHQLFNEYRKINDARQKEFLKVFPNTDVLLKNLKSKNYKLAIFSNKIHKTIVAGLKEKNLDIYFDYILGVDEVVNPKPHPEGILKIKEIFNDECIYIGDTASDMMSAKNANVLAIGVTQAGATKESLIKGGADYIIEKISDLEKLLEDINV